MSAWGYYALLGDRRLTRAAMDATQGERADVASQMFFGAPAGGSTLTLTPDPGAMTIGQGTAVRLAATLRPATGALTLGQGAAPSLGGAAPGSILWLFWGAS